MSKIIFTEVAATPSPPAAGQTSIYVKTDEVIYIQNSAGIETPLGTSTAITALTGDGTATGPGSATLTIPASVVTGKALTGFVSGPNSAVLATDTVLQGLQKLQAQISAGGSAITALTGDVSASGPGSAAATVNSVGGASASSIATSVSATSAATASNTASTIVLRDASGNFSANLITANLSGNATTATSSTSFSGSLSGDVTGTQLLTVVSSVGGKTASQVGLTVDAVTAATPVNTASTLVSRDASGNFAANIITATLSGNASNITATTNSTLTTLSALSLPGSQVTGNIPGNSAGFTGSLSGDVTGSQTTTSIASSVVTGKLLTGYVVGTNTPLSPTDSILSAFEKIQGQIDDFASSNVIDVTASSPLFSSGGDTPNITIQQSNSTQSGFLSSADWNTFNSKQPAGSYLTALTGDATASGPGSAAVTLATVNSSPGTYSYASITVNGKGLVTATSSGAAPVTTLAAVGSSPNANAATISGNTLTLQPFSAAQPGLVLASGGGTTNFLRADGTWAAPPNSGGTVTAVSVVSANGFAGTSSGGTTPALTISTTVTGVLKGDGTSISAAVAGTDYVIPSGNITGTASNITATSNSTLTTLSALSLPGSQVTGDISGNATNVTGIVAIANGGTGQTTPNAAFNALSPMTTGGDLIYGGASGVATRLPNGTAGQVLTSSGGTAAPTWTSVSTSSGITRSVNSISTPTTLASAPSVDYVYLVSGTTTVTLPTAVGNTNLYSIKNVGTGTVTIATTSSETIDGSITAQLIVRYVSVDLISDGSNWNVI